MNNTRLAQTVAGLAKAPAVPVSYFSMVLGLAGLGNAWSVAHKVWLLPSIISIAINGIAVCIWVGLLLLYICKWTFARAKAIHELNHPINCSLIGLIGISSMLVAGIAAPYSQSFAIALFLVSALCTLGYAVWQTGAIWKSDRQHDNTTAILYLPTVAGSFVMGTIAARLGFPQWGQLAFGAGLFSWLAIESVLAHRLYAVDQIPQAQRPSLGIQFAPPAVGSVTYLSITSGHPDLMASALAGYSVLQALVIFRMISWIRAQPFGPSYWAFTFGAASLASTFLIMLSRGSNGPAQILAPVVFIAANIIVGIIFLATLRLLVIRFAQAFRCHETPDELKAMLHVPPGA
ncbi:MAG: dicarboxylate transporter/tellurite-resistance protein TehA [Rhodospirillales bacterium]|nr:dicarboxylate transporter/tellurite-resistance protein TehA [Rhodospirillales bacterium]